jgi:hypothetical protein
MSAVVCSKRPDRTRHRWQSRKAQLFEQAREIIDRLSDYWPLTLHQVYYQLVSAGVLPNRLQSYKGLSGLLAEARLNGSLGWNCLEGRSHARLSAAGWPDSGAFIRDQLEDLLTGYRRDLLQTQVHRLELWVEKDALAHIVARVADPWCVSVVIAKGWSSMTFKHQCGQRALADRRPTRILYLGDLDPSGWQVLPSMMRGLQVELGLGDQVSAERVALNPEQAVALELPYSVDALKEKDSNAQAYRQWLTAAGYPPDLAVELDALPPATLEQLVKDALRRNVDLSAFQAEQERAKAENAGLQAMRERAKRALAVTN